MGLLCLAEQAYHSSLLLVLLQAPACLQSWAASTCGQCGRGCSATNADFQHNLHGALLCLYSIGEPLALILFLPCTVQLPPRHLSDVLKQLPDALRLGLADYALEPTCTVALPRQTAALLREVRDRADAAAEATAAASREAAAADAAVLRKLQDAAQQAAAARAGGL